jgi:Cu+-exporting ATPase
VAVPVDGMSCAACVASVRNGLKSLDGVTGVEVNLAQREAKVEYESEKVSPEKIVKAINELGYRAGEPKVEKAK